MATTPFFIKFVRSEIKSCKSWKEKLENPPLGLPKVVKGPHEWKKLTTGVFLRICADCAEAAEEDAFLQKF